MQDPIEAMAALKDEPPRIWPPDHGLLSTHRESKTIHPRHPLKTSSLHPQHRLLAERTRYRIVRTQQRSLHTSFLSTDDSCHGQALCLERGGSERERVDKSERLKLRRAWNSLWLDWDQR
jgi:hypothetical protein